MSKFGGDKIRRDFCQSQTNLFNQVRTGANFSAKLFHGVNDFLIAYKLLARVDKGCRVRRSEKWGGRLWD